MSASASKSLPSRTAPIDQLSTRDFERLARFIQSHSGIKMPPTKKTMVEGRLRRRVAAVGATDLKDYCHFLFDRGGLETEYVHLIDAISTNKTEFFREPEHFRFLSEVAVPQLLTSRTGSANKVLKVWSAASSIGAEPYTLAMVLADLQAQRKDFDFAITASDISTRVLRTAMDAIYPEEMIAPISEALRKRYLMRAKDKNRRVFRIAPELRRAVKFGRINLMETPYPIERRFDVVFCRNILIYFDKPTQQAVLSQICDHMIPGGYLFLGHSETLASIDLPVTMVGTTVFRKVMK